MLFSKSSAIDSRILVVATPVAFVSTVPGVIIRLQREISKMVCMIGKTSNSVDKNISRSKSWDGGMEDHCFRK